jgi:hypothetical protein
MLNGWPQRGDTVLLTRGPEPVELRVSDTRVVADTFAFLKGYAAGSNRQGTYFVERCDVRPVPEVA